MRIRFTPRARADLQSIQSYINKFNPAAARRVIGSIRRRIEVLKDYPRMGQLAGEADVRAIVTIQYSYRIYYRIAGEEVFVIHIRHTSRRLPVTGEL